MYGINTGALGTYPALGDKAALDAFFGTSYLFDGNVIARGNATKFPAGNYFPTAVAGIGYLDVANNNFQLASSSPYKGKGTDGNDPGANMSVLQLYTNGAISGTWSPPLPPPPPAGTPDAVPPAAPANFH